jgi:hypothetical protein
MHAGYKLPHPLHLQATSRVPAAPPVENPLLVGFKQEFTDCYDRFHRAFDNLVAGIDQHAASSLLNELTLLSYFVGEHLHLILGNSQIRRYFCTVIAGDKGLCHQLYNFIIYSRAYPVDLICAAFHLVALISNCRAENPLEDIQGGLVDAVMHILCHLDWSRLDDLYTCSGCILANLVANRRVSIALVVGVASRWLSVVNALERSPSATNFAGQLMHGIARCGIAASAKMDFLDKLMELSQRGSLISTISAFRYISIRFPQTAMTIASQGWLRELVGLCQNGRIDSYPELVQLFTAFYDVSDRLVLDKADREFALALTEILAEAIPWPFVIGLYAGEVESPREVSCANFLFLAANVHRVTVMRYLVADCNDPLRFYAVLNHYAEDQAYQLKAGAGRILHYFLNYLVEGKREEFLQIAAHLRGQMDFVVWLGELLQSEQFLVLESRLSLLSIYELIFLRVDFVTLSREEHECLLYLVGSGPCILDIINDTLVETHPGGGRLTQSALTYVEQMRVGTSAWIDFHASLMASQPK